MKLIELTRSLYIKDEVELMIMDSLLYKKSVDEIIFWVAEYYYSGYNKELWNILWKCYYDFYAFTNPKLEYLLLKKHLAWNKIYRRKITNVNAIKGYGYIIDFIKTLRICTSTPNIFLFRLRVEQGLKTNILTLYKGRKPSLLSKYDEKYRHFIHSLHKNDESNIIYYFNNYNPDELYIQLVKYFEEDRHIRLNKECSAMIWSKLTYSKKHVLLGIYKIMFQTESNISSNKILIKHTDKNIEYIKRLRYCNNIPFKFLKTMRQYGVTPRIGCFALSRFNIDNLQNNIWYHWEYYAYNNPVWNERFRIFKGIINNVTNEVDFKNDTFQDKFYDKYGYEPDEQSREVQDKSYIHIQKLCMDKWLSIMFGKSGYDNNDDEYNMLGDIVW